jgi:monoterpene epsilon-lactone hydrolase
MSGAARDEGDGIWVPEHFVPTPSTISPQAQAFLRMSSMFGGHKMPESRDDLAGWRAFREAGDVAMVAIGKQYQERFPCEMETHALSASTLYELTPHNLAPENAGRAIIYIHGGGFVAGGGNGAIFPAMQMAGLARTKVYSIDYRLVPEVAFPVPVEDCLEAYRFVLSRHDAAAIGIFGPSAGANLAPAMIVMARDAGVAMPAACALHSCPSDMATFGDSGWTNFMVDIILREPMPALSSNYANGHDLTDPLLSPVFADYGKGFPPTILTSGTRDLLLSGTVRLHRAMLKHGVRAELHVWEAMTHAPFFNAPEEEELYLAHVEFMLRNMT